MARHGIRWGFVLFALIVFGFVLWTVGPDVKSLVAIFFLADLLFGVTAMVYGRRHGRPGIIVGGALCLLMTFGSFVPEPGVGTLVMQVLAGAVGMGPVVVAAAGKALDS